MRDFLRGCLVWFVGYPLSVIAAAAVLTAPVWMTAPAPLDRAVAMVLGAAPVVGFFALLPAVLTPTSPHLWSFVMAGARTGMWCSALALSAFAVTFVAVIVGQIIRLLVEGRLPPEMPAIILTGGFTLCTAVALFAVASAVGGLVFGLTATWAPER